MGGVRGKGISSPASFLLWWSFALMGLLQLHLQLQLLWLGPFPWFKVSLPPLLPLSLGCCYPWAPHHPFWFLHLVYAIDSLSSLKIPVSSPCSLLGSWLTPWQVASSENTLVALTWILIFVAAGVDGWLLLLLARFSPVLLPKIDTDGTVFACKEPA